VRQHGAPVADRKDQLEPRLPADPARYTLIDGFSTLHDSPGTLHDPPAPCTIPRYRSNSSSR
jgi:hypothetical protein